MQMIYADDIKEAVKEIAPYLEDTSNDAPRAIYFDGWSGLGASAVLRAIAELSPQLFRDKFNKIIHIDCSMWKSQRALQRVIAEELKLTQQVAAIDMEDEEDDFSGVDQGSRAEVRDTTRVIGRHLVQHRCLVIFHNGSSSTVDLASFGIPMLEYLGTKVLWTFRGRLRLNRELKERVDKSHLCLHAYDHDGAPRLNWWTLYRDWDYGSVDKSHLADDAREIALHTHKLVLGVTPEIATECCLYLLSLNNQGKKMIDYKWATHASGYWVCDGIIGGGHDNKTWDVAHALQQQIRLEDYSSNAELMMLVERLDLSSKQWISITESYFEEVLPETTTLFFAPDKSTPRVVSLPSDKFHKADQLRVLKLCGCSFSFSSPPFHCCRNLRFLGLDRCKDELQQGEREKEEEEEKTYEPAAEIFQRLWVLDVCHTDWPLAFPPETEEQVVATDIREVYITNGRIWRSNLPWKCLPNLHKLRVVVEPKNPWDTYQGLPSSLESFSLDAGRDHENEARISRISLAGCEILSDFVLRGSLPNLEELDLSHTAIKILDLGEVVEVKNLRRLFLMGCRQLRFISWPKTEMHKLRLLCIDTRAKGGEVANKKPWPADSSLVVYQEDKGKEYCHASVAITDMRLLQSMEFLWKFWGTIRCYKWNLCLSSTSNDDGRSCHNDNMGRPYCGSEQLTAAALCVPKSLIYDDIDIEQISGKIDASSSSSSMHQFLPLDRHMEIGEGISDIADKASMRARNAVRDVMNMSVQSLHVHDSSSITGVAPEHIFVNLDRDYGITMNDLKWCRVERCPKLDTVFGSSYCNKCCTDLEIFWAAHLLMARSIWRRPRNPNMFRYSYSPFWFAQLRAIHLHFCPRLRYVLPMASNSNLFEVLETLHIHCCGDLRQVFLEEQMFQRGIQVWSEQHEGSTLKFPNLKSLYLYELPNLQHICEDNIYAPKLMTIYIRGCWCLRRLPATRGYGRPVAVDCEKDWWDKLKWDREDYRHHPSFFEPRQSRHYKRRHLRGTVLR